MAGTHLRACTPPTGREIRILISGATGVIGIRLELNLLVMALLEAL